MALGCRLVSTSVGWVVLGSLVSLLERVVSGVEELVVVVLCEVVVSCSSGGKTCREEIISATTTTAPVSS
ncbi:MAG: hypothetical protein E6167_08015, partial [Varibaculum cambriense]|nr:hypothetical protein [Varibaculum cambriense]